MGLCKCPKRKVTNLFCFEHRVNVCEHCMVANHPKCVVKSYLQWLQDSDYNSNCPLCDKPLQDGEVVRLMCYDVFHWDCLDEYARQMPANTAPAGYSCPSCTTCIFPPGNMASPVAENLRQLLAQVNWGRSGLGLSLIPDSPSMNNGLTNHVSENQSDFHIPIPEETVIPQQNHMDSKLTRINKQQDHDGYTNNSVAIGNEKTEAFTRTDKLANLIKTPEERKVYDTRKEDAVVDIVHDHDTDKYKRRSALHWFARWFKSRTDKRKTKADDSSASMRRMAILLILGLIAFFTLVVVMTSVGRAAADNDPLLDPLANPNVRIGRRAV